MELILASRNKKKIREVEAILANHFPGIRILSLDDVGYIGDIEENGETYEENALTKARTAVEAGNRQYPAIADDSGLEVDFLTPFGLCDGTAAVADSLPAASWETQSHPAKPLPDS